ncbi:MAG: hypothetical protein HDT07_06110 [Bacteroidales bacterium]|nr:hypothetical protein [Bacteroidales bacterium]
MQHILIPISICVILPIAVVLIISLQKRNSDNKRAEVLLKAIETNKDIDVDRLTEAMSYNRPRKTPAEIRNRRLLSGCIFTLIGLFLAILGLSLRADGWTFGSDNVFIPFMFGGCSMAVGLSFLIVYYAPRNQKD